jgi:hypothetical protein
MITTKSDKKSVCALVPNAARKNITATYGTTADIQCSKAAGSFMKVSFSILVIGLTMIFF